MSHWQGRQSLAWSVAVNLVALRVLIAVTQAAISPAEGTDYSTNALLVFVLALFFHGVVFLWQVVGTLRAAERHIQQKGPISGMWGAQICAIIVFWFTATDAFEAWQMTIYQPPEENFALRMDREHASQYSLTQSPDGTAIELSGTITHGVSKKFARALQSNPDIKTVILESDGGNIYEARGLSKLIREHHINTVALSKCSSACTTVFIAGTRRVLGAGAKLGFHQYRLDANYDVPGADPAAEQNRDRALYSASGVADWFQEKMFNASANQMWFPTNEELITAGVVHEIAQ